MAGIGLAELEELFSRMRDELDPDQPLNWGYVFIAAEKRSLRPVADEMLAAGYREGGLLVAAIWSLSTLGLHFMMQRLNARRLRVEEQNRRLKHCRCAQPHPQAGDRPSGFGFR